MKKLVIAVAVASFGLVATPAFAGSGCSCPSGGGHSAMASSPSTAVANGSTSTRRFSYDPSMSSTPVYRGSNGMTNSPRATRSFGIRGADSKVRGNY